MTLSLPVYRSAGSLVWLVTTEEQVALPAGSPGLDLSSSFRRTNRSRPCEELLIIGALKAPVVMPIVGWRRQVARISGSQNECSEQHGRRCQAGPACEPACFALQRRSLRSR